MTRSLQQDQKSMELAHKTSNQPVNLSAYHQLNPCSSIENPEETACLRGVKMQKIPKYGHGDVLRMGKCPVSAFIKSKNLKKFSPEK